MPWADRFQDSLEGDAVAQAAPAHLSHQGACEDRKLPGTLRVAAGVPDPSGLQNLFRGQSLR